MPRKSKQRTIFNSIPGDMFAVLCATCQRGLRCDYLDAVFSPDHRYDVRLGWICGCRERNQHLIHIERAKDAAGEDQLIIAKSGW